MPQSANRRLIETLTALAAPLGRKLLRAHALSSRTEELLDDVARSLNDLIDLVKSNLVSLPHSEQRATILGAQLGIRRLSKKPAQEAVSAVLVWRRDGSALARVDGASIPLPPKVAVLLDILVADRGFAADNLVGWKTVADILAVLKERTQQGHSKAAVKELVYRLRCLLECHGASASLVRSHRRLGYRFAVRRAPGSIPKDQNL
jgi:DNA-binding winged helix-turn-helix (wHTH) protein